MNFEDTPQEAAFRAEARAWIAANAPREYEADLRTSPFGSVRLGGRDVIAASKAWQKKKQQAGWACLHWPRAYGGRGATPIERVIWQQEEGIFSKLSQAFIIGHGMCGPTLMPYATEEQKRRYCRRWPRAKRSGASFSRSRRRAPISRACARAPSATATIG